MSIARYRVSDGTGDFVALTERTPFGETTVTIPKSDVRLVADLLLHFIESDTDDEDTSAGV